MSALKHSIINRDQSDKKWLTEDYENHWTAPPAQETKAADTAINYFLLVIAILLTVIVYVAVRGL